MNLKAAFAFFYVLLATVCSAAEGIDDPAVQAVCFGFSPHDQDILNQVWQEAKKAHPEQTSQSLIRAYYGFATPGMEAADLALVWKALSITPFNKWGCLKFFVDSFFTPHMAGNYQASIIQEAAVLCDALEYKPNLMKEFSHRYAQFMPLVLEKTAVSENMRWLTEAMKQGVVPEKADEYWGLLQLELVGEAHARVFKSLGDLYTSEVKPEERDGSMAFCQYFFSCVEGHSHVTPVDVVEIVNTFGIISQMQEGLTEKFIKESSGLPKLQQLDLMLNLITDFLVDRFKDPQELESFMAKLFSSDAGSAYANVYTRNSLAFALSSKTHPSSWDDFAAFYHRLFNPKVMDGFVAAEIITHVDSLYVALDKKERDNFLGELEARLLEVGTINNCQYIKLLNDMSDLYQALPNADKRQIAQERAAQWCGKGTDEEMNVFQCVAMEAAYAKVMPVLDAIAIERASKIMTLWDESRKDFHLSQQPDEFRKLLRMFQLKELKKKY